MKTIEARCKLSEHGNGFGFFDGFGRQEFRTDNDGKMEFRHTSYSACFLCVSARGALFRASGVMKIQVR